MGLLRGRDGFQFGAGVGGRVEAEPAERGVKSMEVGWFKALHADRKTVAREIGKRL